MDLKLFSQTLIGQVNIPSSKSITHRALICSSLAHGRSIIHKPLYCEDTQATIACLESLGLEISQMANKIIVNGKGYFQLVGLLDAKESATTLRFLIGLISYFIPSYSIYVHPQLLKRFVSDDLKALEGLRFSCLENKIEVKGLLTKELKNLSTNLTSQWVSSQLLALPLVKNKVHSFVLDNEYVKLTASVMKAFGVEIINKNNYLIAESKYQASEMTIEVDYSSLAFFLGMALFNPQLLVGPISQNSLQPDFRIITFFEKMVASFIEVGAYLKLERLEPRDCLLDLSQNPDLAPLLAAVSSVLGKKVTLTGLSRLKYKESDRLEAIYTTLKTLGANLEIKDNSLVIYGKNSLKGGVSVDSYRDHRIIMSLAAITNKIDQPFIIRGSEYVVKSFPDFWLKFTEIGGKYESSLS